MSVPALRVLSHHYVLVEGAESCGPPLLLLHGSGGGEGDLLPLAGAVAGGAPVIAIRGAEAWEGGFAFFRRFEDRSIDEGNLVVNAVALAGFIEAVCLECGFSRLPVAVGFSNGAIMGAALLLMRPGLLGGAVLLRPLWPFVGYEGESLGGVPVLVVDGGRDERRLAGDGLRVAEGLREAGGCVEHQVLDVGHGITGEDRCLVGGWLGRFW